MEDIFLKFVKEGITPNSYYVLHCIKNKIVPYSFISKELETKRLINDGWLKDDLTLTDKSIIFTTEIDGYFKRSKKKTSKNLLGDNFEDSIKKYTEIFPARKQNTDKTWDSDLADYCEMIINKPDDEIIFIKERLF